MALNGDTHKQKKQKQNFYSDDVENVVFNGQAKK